MPTEHGFCRELGLGVKAMLGHLSTTTQKRIVFLVLGILLSESVVLRRIASKQESFLSGSTSAPSHERRLRRVLGYPDLSWGQIYVPTLKQVLRWQQAKRLLILVDESGHSEVFRVLTAAVWYRNRAIPLAWVSWVAQQPLGRSYWEYVEELLAKVQPLLPLGVQIIVIADRAFGHPTFIDLVAARGWDWLVRVQHQTCYRDVQGKCTQLNQILTRPGQRWRGRGRLFKKAGWRESSCVAYWGRSHREPLLLASSLPADWDLIDTYRRRGAIETLFRDWKSSGWNWEASQVRTLAHHERLLIGMAWATLVVLCLGNQVANELLAEKPRPRRTLPWHSKHSLFRLGLDRLDARLYNTVQTPLAWELADFDAPGWQRQLRQRNTQAFVHSPTLPKAA
jgi:hypothetical protein